MTCLAKSADVKKKKMVNMKKIKDLWDRVHILRLSRAQLRVGASREFQNRIIQVSIVAAKKLFLPLAGSIDGGLFKAGDRKTSASNYRNHLIFAS